MKQPQRIILIRHGESVRNLMGENADGLNIPTYLYGLTEKGHAQAAARGIVLRELIQDEPALFITSDYMRAQLTLKGILKAFADHPSFDVRVDPILREKERQDANGDQPGIEISKFYSGKYRILAGETDVNVYDRMVAFWNGVQMEMMMETLPKNLIIVSHDRTLRNFVTLLYGVGYKGFEATTLPDNCQMIVFEPTAPGQYRSDDPWLDGLRKVANSLRSEFVTREAPELVTV